MKIRNAIAILLVGLLASGALAQGNGMGVFFSDTEFTDATTNTAGGPDPIDMYLVVLDCVYASVGNYECSISFAGTNLPSVLDVGFPAGSAGTNFGDSLNHLVIYGTPVPTVNGAAVLAILSVEATEPSEVEVLLGPSVPSSTPGSPMVANGDNIDEFVACGLTSGADIPGVVATINGSGVTPVEAREWSAIRNLFD